MERGFAFVNNTKLYYEIAGAGRPIIFMHGFALDTRTWEDQFTAFSEKYLVVRYDMRGFGKSSLPTDECYSNAQDLKSLTDYLGINHLSLVGHSRGGRYAIDFALEYKENVDKLIVADAMPNGFIASHDLPMSSNEIITIAHSKGMQAARETWFNDPLFACVKCSAHLSRRVWEMILDYSGWHWINQDPVQNSTPLAALRLSEITAQTLIIVGENDTVNFLQASVYLNKKILNSSRVVLRGAGHMSIMETAADFNTSLQNFLDEP